MSRTYDVVEKYTGTGSVSAYTFDFKVTSLSDLLIIKTDASNVKVFEIRGTDVTHLTSVVMNAGNRGGTVNLVANVESGYKLIIRLAQDAPTQSDIYKNQQNFSLKNLEESLDYQNGAIQRLVDLVKRCLRIPDQFLAADFDPQLPSNFVGSNKMILMGNATGTGLLNPGKTFDELAAAASVGASFTANRILQTDASGVTEASGNMQKGASGGLILGDAGTEDSGIDVNGVIYESTLKVSDIDGTNFAQTIVHRHSTVLEPLVLGARSNSDTVAHGDVTAGQSVFSIFAAGRLVSNYKLFGIMKFVASSLGALSNTSSPGKIIFQTTPNASVTPTDHLTLDSDKSSTFAGAVSAVSLALTTPLPATSGGSPMTTGGDLIYGGTAGLPTRLANGVAGQFLKSNGTTLAPSWTSFTSPTVQIFTSGSGTYTTPANVKYITVEMIGGGGGGGGSGTSSTGGNGGNGVNSTFGANLTAGGGIGGGNTAGSGGNGGTAIASVGVGKVLNGGGGAAVNATVTLANAAGGKGADSALGGGGVGGIASTSTAGAANTGGGGGGGGTGAVAGNPGMGAGSGAYIDVMITTPSASYSYAVGAGGTAGTAGTSGNAGGAGGSGIIIVTEYY